MKKGYAIVAEVGNNPPVMLARAATAVEARRRREALAAGFGKAARVYSTPLIAYYRAGGALYPNEEVTR